jgi:hypothetical protein
MSESLFRNIGVLLWIVLGINLGKIPRIFSSEVPCPERVIYVEGETIVFCFQAKILKQIKIM